MQAGYLLPHEPSNLENIGLVAEDHVCHVHLHITHTGREAVASFTITDFKNILCVKHLMLIFLIL